ncbi:hypothetical protein GCM10009733_008440 [Nonomuraea maheshkhaliensis]|uniref:WXG100 family type VII secretion target n=1 Tax=Nonomuraea maheshkhaliensis TaxID=419590 RepID=A0ABP4QQW2_9ACTN
MTHKTLACNAANTMAGVHQHRATRLQAELDAAKATLAGSDEGLRSFMANCARRANRFRKQVELWQRWAEQTEGVIDRVWELAQQWRSQPPADETVWSITDPTQGHRSAGQEIVALIEEMMSD